jgi:2-oxoglutarate ferredoxin oxidoreductase subunit delta
MIEIDESLCKGCYVCIEFCPLEVFIISDKITVAGVYPPHPEYIEKCTACKLCELMCPDFAISVGDKK